jgi:predicted metal-binding protein
LFKLVSRIIEVVVFVFACDCPSSRVFMKFDAVKCKEGNEDETAPMFYGSEMSVYTKGNEQN